MIRRALEETGGNRTKAARLLNISERTLRNKLNVPRSRPTAQVRLGRFDLARDGERNPADLAGFSRQSLPVSRRPTLRC